MRLPRVSSNPALVVTAPAAAIDLAAALAIGDGISLGTARPTVEFPMLGPAEIAMEVVVVAVTSELAAGRGDRLRLSVFGNVEIDFGENSAVPSPPYPIGVELVADVQLAVLLGNDAVEVVLDLAGAEFVSARVVQNPEAEFDPFAQVGDMLFAQIGADLFGGLADSVGTLGDTIAPVPLERFGLADGPAEVRVGDGVLVVAVAGREPAEDGAKPVAAGGNRIGVSVAGAAVGPVVASVAEQSLRAPLPFEVSSRVGAKGLTAKVRNQRILPDSMPDLRPGLYSTMSITTRPEGVVFALEEAWMASPLLPRAVNRFQRELGGLVASVAPKALTSLTVPSTIPVPIDGGSATHDVHIRSTKVADGRIDVVVDVGL